MKRDNITEEEFDLVINKNENIDIKKLVKL